VSGVVQYLELGRGEPAEGVLRASAVVGPLDPETIANRRSSRVFQRCRLRTFFCRRLKKDSIAALSAQVPTLPIDPRRPWLRSAPRKAWDRN
jgi:hypothetical protein